MHLMHTGFVSLRFLGKIEKNGNFTIIVFLQSVNFSVQLFTFIGGHGIMIYKAGVLKISFEN